MEIDDDTLLRLRWRALLLDDRAGRSAAEVVGWLGAVQAQDPRQAEWAIGVRSGILTRDDVRLAHRDRRIVRTWAMRGTLHAVPAADAHWMIEHLGRRQLTPVRTRLTRAGVDGPQITRALDALAGVLSSGPQTRTACRSAVATVVPELTNQQFSHLIELAALHAIVCPCPGDGAEQWYTLLDSAAPDPTILDRAEAHVTIAERYIRSHGPVTAHDLARWAGITLTDARRAIAELGPQLVTATWNGTSVHLFRSLADSSLGPDDRIRLLPGFDEHIIGYARRQPTVPAEHDRSIVPGGNGIYQPTIARAGWTIGTWKVAGGSALPTLFAAHTFTGQGSVAAAESEFRRFNAPT